MIKLSSSLKAFCLKSIMALSIMSLMLLSNLFIPQYSYAASGTQQSKAEKSQEEIVQPFGLTKPADSREGAYEEAAKLVENPKELVKAQNEEEKAQEKKVEK